MTRLILLIIIFVSMGFIYPKLENENNEIKNIIKFHHELVQKEINSSYRIFVTGGSNAYMSVNSDILEKTFNKQIINISANKELYSYHNMFSLIDSYVKSGDIVLYSSANIFELSNNKNYANDIANYISKMNPNFEKHNYFINYNFPLWTFLPNNQIFASTIKRILFDSNSFDESLLSTKGDYIGCNFKKNSIAKFTKPPNNDKFINDLITFSNILNRKNVTLYVVFPWAYIESKNYEEWSNYISNLKAKLIQNDVKIVNEPNENILQVTDIYFCDTQVHIKREFSELRTQSILDVLDK